MKRKLILLIVLFAIMQHSFAYQYDVILTKSRQQIQCIILSQDETSITYKLPETDDTDIIVMQRDDIAKIYPRTEKTESQTKAEDVVQQTAVNPVGISEITNQSVANYEAKPVDGSSITNNSASPQVVKPAEAEEKPSPDIIVLKDATRINAYIVEVGDDEIKFRKAENQNGPLYTKKTSEISVILYANGTTDMFNNNASNSNPVAGSHTNPYPSADRNYTRQEAPADADWAGGGRHTDKYDNTRTDFPGGHKTVRADGSTEISVPFVTIRKEGGGQGVDMPATDDITGFQVIDFYGRVEDDVIIINKSSRPDCFKVAVCSVKNNQYFWKIVLVTTELQPYNVNISKQKNLYRAKTEDELNETMPTKDRYLYSAAVRSRYGYEYSFKTYIDGDDLIIEVLDPNSKDSEW